MDGVVVKTNIADFKKEIDRLGIRFVKRVVPRAVLKAAQVVRDRARLIAPVLRKPDPRRTPGTLRRNIIARINRSKQPGIVTATVTVRAVQFKSAVKRLKVQRSGKQLDPFYWRFLEGGWIPRGRGKKLRGGTRSKNLQRERSLAAGTKRFIFPFFDPAFKRSGTRALAAFNESITSALTQESRRGR